MVSLHLYMQGLLRNGKLSHEPFGGPEGHIKPGRRQSVVHEGTKHNSISCFACKGTGTFFARAVAGRVRRDEECQHLIA